jgi:hypothetical protein
MAQPKARSSPSSTAPKTQRKSSSSGSSRSSGSRSRSSSSRNGSSRTAASRSRSASSSSRQRQQSAASGNGGSGGGSKTATTILAGAGTVAGLVGGVVLGSKYARKPKRVLGVKVPGTGGGLDGLAKQVGKAGKQFKKANGQLSELTAEVRSAREKAEQVGKVIS